MPPSQVVESLLGAGVVQEGAIPLTMRIIAREALFVATAFRGRDFGEDLVDAVEERARANGGEYLIARLEADAPGLHEFYRSLDFVVKDVGDALAVEGGTLPSSAEYEDAVKVLVDAPAVTVR